jgi:dethiobiotin synthetase
MKPNPILISATHTDAGKTLVSSVLVAGLKADYWKPIQAGTLPETDSQFVQRVLGIPSNRIHAEAYLLPYPESPHSSAAKAGVEIQLDHIRIPQTENQLVIEGAGGLLVPLTTKQTVLDLFASWQLPITLVVPLYLGAINHSLLSLEVLKARKIAVSGIIFNGTDSPAAKEAILEMSGAKNLGHIPQLEQVNEYTLLKAFEKLTL